MGVRAKRGQWPDVDGDYQIVDTDGCYLFYVLGGSFGPDTEAVAERILAAINGDTVPAPTLDTVTCPEGTCDGCPDAAACAALRPAELPSWVSMHATATGADLIEHDPNGEAWERLVNRIGWVDDHRQAQHDRTYLVRRRPVPVEPTTEKVPWWEAVERGLAVIGRDGEFVMDCGVGDVVAYLDGARWALMYDDASHEELKRPLADPDGMVTVLREDGAS